MRNRSDPSESKQKGELLTKQFSLFPLKPFQSIEETVRSTGLSAYFLRKGIREGTVPYIRSGSKYMIIVPKLLESLDALPSVQEG